MKQFRITFLLSFAFIFFLSSRQVWAVAEIPSVPDHYVNDSAGLLSVPVRDSLEEKLAQFERDTSNQVLVATFPDLQGETIEDFSIRLAEKWKPGQSGRDNGVILVVSKGDRKVRIEVGYGLEGVIPDAVAKTILAREVLPGFKTGDYEGGIRSGVEAILQASAGEYKGIPVSGAWLPWILPGLIFVAFILGWIMLARMRSYGVRRSGAYDYGGWSSGSSSWESSGSSWGSSDSSSSGSFSSGGGSFGGGGASGSW